MTSPLISQPKCLVHLVTRPILLAGICLVICSCSFAQWETMYGPLPVEWGDYITGMSFVNDSVGYVSGFNESNNGTTNYIVKTTDYANTWDTIFTHNHEPLAYAQFQDVFFIDETTGWVCGTNLGCVFKTTDGGQTWTSYPIPEEIELLYRIKFADEDYGIAMSEDVGNTGIETFDGGLTWSSSPPINGYDVSFLDACNFVVVRGGGIRQFNDCVSTSQAFPTINELGDRNGRAVYMQDNNNWVLGSIGLAGGNFASILTTNDGGQTFMINDLLFANWVRCFGFITDEVGFASVSDADEYPCAVLKTLDGGETWFCQETPIFESPFSDQYHVYFEDIECPSASVQYGCFPIGIFRTTNGGGPLGDTYTGVKVTPQKPKTLSLYPNPTSSTFRIEATKPHEVRAIELYNTTGQLVAQYTTMPYEIDVKLWPSGCYNVVVKYDNEVVRTRVVVE